jgi:hypothetical protein
VFKKAYKPEYLVPTMEHGGGSNILVFCWSCQITASDYVDILRNHVHPVIHMLLPKNDEIFQDDHSPIHTAESVESWFDELEAAVQHLPWPAQSPPDFNIIEPVWSVSQSRVRSRFLLPSSLKQLEVFLHEE